MPEISDIPRRQQSRPKASWLPLTKAVFRFGMADDSEATANKSSVGGAIDATAVSLLQLKAILMEKSGAYCVDIDPIQCTFTFQFSDRSGVARHGGCLKKLMAQNLHSIHERKPKPFSTRRAL
jgi:hypothetical protein